MVNNSNSRSWFETTAWHFFSLIISVCACSTSVILIKASTEDPYLLASYRLLLAALVLLPFFLRDLKQHRANYSFQHLRATLLPGVVLGLHFITWNIGARMTPAAHGSLIINLVPVASPFLLYFVIKELVTIREIVGTVITLAGACLLSFQDLSVSAEWFTGDWVCFLSMLLVSLYMVLGRLNRRQLSTVLYLVPLYTVAGLFCFAAALFVVNPIKAYSWNDILLTVGLALVPTVIGHSLYNYSLRHFRGQLVSLVTVTQFVPSAILAYYLLGESVSWRFYPATAVVLIGTVLVLARNNKRESIPPEGVELKECTQNP
jgi:drug/metabolite transporter (DMT)-like permease